MNADQYSKVGLPGCRVDVKTTTVKHLANARTKNVNCLYKVWSCSFPHSCLVGTLS
jgi:hypothetical protein